MNQQPHTTQVSLAEIAEVILGFSTSRVQPATDGLSANGDLVRFVQVRDIQELGPASGGKRPFEGRLAPLADLADTAPRLPGINWDRFTLRTGDVVLTSKGSSLKTALVEQETAGAVATSNLIILRPNQRLVLPRVLLAILRLPSTDAKLRKTSRSSQLAIALNPKDVGKVIVPLPSMPIQADLAETLAATEAYLREGMLALDRKAGLVADVVERMILKPGVRS